MKRLRTPRLRTCRAWSVGIALAGVTLLLAACGNGDITAPDEGSGTIVVSLRTSGVQPDLDGYIVRVDGGSPQPVDVDGTITLTEVPAGARTVSLEGAAVTCDPEGGAERQVTLPRYGTAYVHWAVVCTAKPIVFSSLGPGATGPFLYRMNVDGTGVKQLGTSVGYRPRWSPDGMRILFNNGSRLVVMRPDGSGAGLVTVGSSGAWSPDGSRIAFNRFRGEWGMWGDVYTIGVDGSGEQKLRLPNSSYDLDWGPDGRIAFIEWYQRAEGTASQSWLSVMNADGTGVTRLYEAQDGESIGRPAWSPDGSRVAFSVQTSEGSAIFTVDPDGSALRRRSAPGVRELEPRWFTDGRTLLFTSYVEGFGSELRMGAHDSETSASISHFPSDHHEGDIRPGALPPS